MKKIITYGTFDLLHYGHINLLQRAKEMGDYLIVALSTDEFNSVEKNKITYFLRRAEKTSGGDKICGSGYSRKQLGTKNIGCKGI